MTGEAPHPLAARLADYVVSGSHREYPDDVLDLARMCLADWVCVTLGAVDEPAAIHISSVVDGWSADGPSCTFRGSRLPPPLAALVNGTLAHCLDYDDVHFPSLSHLSAPTWAALLALAAGTPCTAQRLLECFVTGFEIGARLGSNGVGPAVLDRGWHATGVVGRLAATVASAALLGLDRAKVIAAVAIAATQTSGLTASFGTDAKPLHAGKAAFDAILSAQLAASGFRGAADVIDRRGGLIDTLVQLAPPEMRLDDLEHGWKIRENALKPYACCGMTHAAIDAARYLATEAGARHAGSLAHVTRVDVEAHPLTSKVAAQTGVTTPLAAKFSIAYCTALGLSGYRATVRDFATDRIAQPDIARLAHKVVLHSAPAMAATAARVSVAFDDGTQISHLTEVSLGNPGNPMSWDDLREKFIALVESKIGARSAPLFEHLRHFGRARDAEGMWAIVLPRDPPIDTNSFRPDGGSAPVLAAAG